MIEHCTGSAVSSLSNLGGTKTMLLCIN